METRRGTAQQVSTVISMLDSSPGIRADEVDREAERVLNAIGARYGVILHMRSGGVGFYVENQAFELAATFEDEPGTTADEHRAWFAKQLGTALERLAHPKAQRVDRERL